MSLSTTLFTFRPLSFKMPSLQSQSCLSLRKKESHLYLNLLPLKKMLLLQTVFIWLDFAHLSHAHREKQKQYIIIYYKICTGGTNISGCSPTQGSCCRSNLHVWLRIIYPMKHRSTRDGARVHELTTALRSVTVVRALLGCLYKPN